MRQIPDSDDSHDLTERYKSTLKDIVLKLPLRERQIIYLECAEDLTISEISEILVMREDHVNVLLRRAKSKIILEAKKAGLGEIEL